MIKIGGYLIDAAISEEETLEADVTEYPVESGGTLTDHVTNKPRTLELEFKVSDTPIGEVESQRPAGVVPSSEARQKLEALRATRLPFTVITRTRAYENMVFASLSFPRDGQTGDALVGRASLRQLQIVDVRRVSVAIQKNGGRRAGRGASGKKMWLCPANVSTADTDAANLRQGCREVIYRKPDLVFADTGAKLTDAQLEAFNKRLTLRAEGFDDGGEAAIRNLTIGTGNAKIQWDPVDGRYVDSRSGVPIARQPSREVVLAAHGYDIPEDYQPPERLFDPLVDKKLLR